MQELISKLYELMYSPIITPYNLLDNAKLDNYDYVNYSKHNGGLLVTMKCEIEKNYKVKFFYHFDENDRLMRAIMKSQEGQEVMFCRETETNKVKEVLCKDLKQPFSKFAI